MTPDLKALDARDALAPIKEEFHQPDGIIYLDGNSLGLMPLCVKKRIQEVTEQQWAEDLITSWNKHQWIDLPTRIGDRIGALVGAAPGQIVCNDSISVNLFKVLCAGLKLAALKLNPRRNTIVSTKDNFPTDLYMVQGIQDLLGSQRCQLKLVEEHELESAIDSDTAALMVTEVNFRTGKRLDAQSLTEKAHEQGALMILDLAHSAGVLPVQLDNWQVDFAVGCTYKYLNSGPGAPAFVYAATRHQQVMQQPLYGWMGHNNMFAFDQQYTPADDIKQMLVGTPSVISMSAVDAALDVYDKASIKDIREKSMQLTSTFLELVQASQVCSELNCISPTKAEQRGSQLSFEFEHAYALCQALIAKGIIADFRAPNYIRFGFAPLYNSFEQIGIAIQEIENILRDKVYLQSEFQVRNKVT